MDLPVVLAAELIGGPLTFIIIGAGAFTLPIIAGRFGLPAIVVEILFGLVVGPQVLGIIELESVDAEFVALLAELGLFLLMFLAGFEVDFERLERQGIRQIATGLILFAAILVLAWIGFGFLSLESTDQRIFLTLLTSAASLGIVIPALRSTRRSTTSLGQVTIIAAVIAEFLSAAGIIFFGVWEEKGFGVELFSVPGLFAIMGVLLVIIRRAAWWYPERFERLFSTDDPDELGIRASLALLFVFVGISLYFDVEPILGAFLAGALFAFIFRNTGPLEERLNGFAYGFFIPIFFINVGIEFPLDRLADSSVLGKAVGLIVIAIVVKILAALLLVFRGFSIRESLAAGALLAGQLSVIIALAGFGVQLGVIDEGLAAGAILLVAVTAVLSPVTFRFLAPPLTEQKAATSAD